MTLAALLARLVLRGVRPGAHPRGGKVHLQVWLASRIQDELAAAGLAGAPWIPQYARLLGAHLGQGVDLHTLPPVTGLLEIGDGAAVEPEVDLGGHWIDGDVFHVGAIRIGKRARIGARSMLAPGAVVGKGAEVAPGSLVLGKVPASEYWSGSPASASPTRPRTVAGRGPVPGADLAARLCPGLARHRRPPGRGPRGRRGRAGPGGCGRDVPGRRTPIDAAVAPAGGLRRVRRAGAARPRPGAGPRLGHDPRGPSGQVRCRGQVWGTFRVLDEARTWLFPLYSSALTPIWLRLLGARIGKGVEASTVLLIPKFAQVNDDAFLADDTLLGLLRARGRLDPGGARQDRQARVRRQLRDGRPRPQGARRRPWSPSCPRPRGAPRPRPGLRGWAARRPSCAGRPAETDPSRTYDPPRRLQVAAAWSRPCRLLPMLLGVLLEVACRGPSRCCAWSGPVAGRRAGRARADGAGGAVAAARHRRGQVGCSSAATAPTSTRSGAASCGATSWPTRSRDDRRAVVRGAAVVQLHQVALGEPVWCHTDSGPTLGAGVWCNTLFRRPCPGETPRRRPEPPRRQHLREGVRQLVAPHEAGPQRVLLGAVATDQQPLAATVTRAAARHRAASPDRPALRPATGSG